MLSRLISLLSRIPAVKWALNRLRPLPHGSSIDAAPGAADEQSAVIAIAEATRAHGSDISPEPQHRGLEVAAPFAEHTATVSVAVESSSARPTDTAVSDNSSGETPIEAEPFVKDEVPVSSIEVASEPVDPPEPINSDPSPEFLTEVKPEDREEASTSSVPVEAVDASEPSVSNDLPVELLIVVEPVEEEIPVSSVEVEAVDSPEPVVSSDASPELPEDVAPVVADEVIVAALETETMPEASGLYVDDEPISVASVETEPVAIDERPVILVDAEVPAPFVAGASLEGEPAESVAAALAPAAANDALPIAGINAPVVAAHVEPPPAPTSKTSGAPKRRAKIVEPADRAALIRQRWTETGIRMWNPRLHGTGEATLNIQGRIALLPPEPGESMPRYDKLEFRMLGGQIVCEGVIVEAPAHAGQRSFTRLAEPRGTDRTREPVRERQAALA
ncbi:hypothetical protein [Bradyrhizobium sp. Gha]|uniref:hypothetical protein n=1 Tax=Bradyrhizobium sp. Gha TaxID=1855318 RepID=UPI0008EFBA3C|nr:hypothetical protein [Bradyrhizobium sp. Gha]SFJ89348.1 hypothetical protein SAMN05216525_14131 [Bradyrhizobium sp. Gha]